MNRTEKARYHTREETNPNFAGNYENHFGSGGLLSNSANRGDSQRCGPKKPFRTPSHPCHELPTNQLVCSSAGKGPVVFWGASFGFPGRLLCVVSGRDCFQAQHPPTPNPQLRQLNPAPCLDLRTVLQHAWAFFSPVPISVDHLTDPSTNKAPRYRGHLQSTSILSRTLLS